MDYWEAVDYLEALAHETADKSEAVEWWEVVGCVEAVAQ